MKNFICLISCLHYFCITINAQPGTLDKSFGDGGKAINEAFTGNCYTIALQPDGKIVTGGYYYNELLKKSASIIARFNNDGSVDNFFGESGKVLVYESDGARASGVISLAIQADGKIMVCNLFFNQRSEGDIGLIRLNTNGSIDSSFDEDGIVIKSIGKDDIAGEMMLQPDGKILVTGKKGVKESEISPVYVIRYLSNGKPDDNFGEKSLVVLPENMYIHEITAIDLQPDGKILCAGFNFSKTFVVIRLLPDGRLDSTFNENGVADLILEQADRFSADLEDIAVQSDGKILAAGSAGSSSDHMIIARFKSDGSIDSAFGEKTGYSILPMASGLSKAYNVYSTNNNSITLTGYYNTGVSTQDFGVVKYNIDGIIDSSFGVNGIATTSFDDLDTYYIGYSSALQPDGKIILGSAVDLTGRGDEENIALVRFNGGKLHSQPDFAKIQKWQGHYGFTWNEWPGNKTTYYSVGRSANAGIFTEIAQVPDITEEKKYKYEDPAPPAGIVYYQLTAVRSDGKKVSSNIIAAGNVVATIKLFPNPAKNSLRIEGLPAEQTTKFTIIDLSGNTKIFSTSAGSSHTFNIAQLKPGNYMLRLETNGNVANRMFVKE